MTLFGYVSITVAESLTVKGDMLTC